MIQREAEAGRAEVEDVWREMMGRDDIRVPNGLVIDARAAEVSEEGAQTPLGEITVTQCFCHHLGQTRKSNLYK